MKRLIAIALLVTMLVVSATGCATEPEVGEPEGDGLHSIVPSVVGLAEIDAAASLDAEGYVVGAVVIRPAEGAESGVVIEQDPIASTSAPRGSEVDLVIAE